MTINDSINIIMNIFDIIPIYKYDYICIKHYLDYIT